MSRGLGLIERLMLGLAAVASLATCLSVGAAKADNIIFGGPGTAPGSVEFDGFGVPGSLLMGITTQTGPASSGSDTGTFTLAEPPAGATISLTSSSSTTFSVGPNSAPFTYTSTTDTDVLSGNLTWTELLDTPNPELIGTLTNVTCTNCDAAMLANWAPALGPGGFGAVQWNLAGMSGLSLMQLTTMIQTIKLNTALGEIEPVPAPIVGAGLPGLIFAGAGLLAWLRRKRTAVAAT